MSTFFQTVCEFIDYSTLKFVKLYEVPHIFGYSQPFGFIFIACYFIQKHKGFFRY